MKGNPRSLLNKACCKRMEVSNSKIGEQFRADDVLCLRKAGKTNSRATNISFIFVF